MALVLKKLIAVFLLPPGCLILFLAVCAALQARCRRFGAAGLLVVPAVVLWVLSTNAVSERLLATLEQGLAMPAHPRGDVIILLGGGLYDGVPELNGRGAPSEFMQSRMVTAVRLQRRLGVPILVSGGSVFGNRSAEAPVVRRFLIELGVPADRVLVEDRSRDTMENARFSRRILADKGFRHPLLVTSAFHMRRSLAAFHRQGIQAVPVPAAIHTLPGRPTVWADWFPDAGALAMTSTVLREYLGLAFYTLAGTGAA